MSPTTSTASDDNSGSVEVLRCSRRDRWAQPLAMIFTATHLLLAIVMVGWYYHFVPTFKYRFEDANATLSPWVVAAIQQSDFFVNHWYLYAPFGIVSLVFDYVIMRWIANELGLKHVAIFATFIASILLINLAFGVFVIVFA